MSTVSGRRLSQPVSQPVPAVPLRPLGRAGARGAEPAELWAGVHLPGFDAADKLERLASRAQRFTPRVSLELPDGLLLEVQGSLHLFAGVAGLRAALLDECRRLGVRPVLAFAPTALAALTAARSGEALVITDPAQLTGALASLPLTALRWPQDTLARLALLGVRTVGAALRLPRAGFARRFGAAQLAMLDVLTGRTPEVRAGFRARERFRRRRELGCELTHHDWLLAALAPLFAELDAFLRARQCSVVELECRFVHRHAPATCCVQRLAAPAADVQRLERLLGEQLSALQLPEPVRACELRAATLVPHLPGSHSLWQPGEYGGEAGRETAGLIERLRARFGPQAVHGLTLLSGHRPENAWAVTEPPLARQRPEGGRSAPAVGTAESGAPAGRRPLWLLPAPQPLAVRNGLPWRRGALRLSGDPERIETGWWDGAEIARDYYTAIDIHGVRLWVFRERTAAHGWFLHGVFG
jgi:protein ImuB